jgi:hypothetical protein
MRKQNAIVQTKANKKVEKAILLSKTIPVKEGFTAKASVFVPRAEKNKPAPCVSLSFDIGYDTTRIVAPDVESLKEVFYNMIGFIDQNQHSIEQSLIKERSRWLDLQQEHINELNNRSTAPIRDIKSA